MLGVDYLLLFVPVVGSPLVLPLVQGLVHGMAGPQITQNVYPNWWVGTLAGYGVNFVGITAIGVGYGLLFANLLPTRPISPPILTTSIALITGGFITFFIEPTVFYLASGIDAHAAPKPLQATAEEDLDRNWQPNAVQALAQRNGTYASMRP